MSDISAPPMGGENLPIKELKPEKAKTVAFQPDAKKVKKSKLYLLFIILLAVFFTGGIVFGLYVRPQQKQKQVASTSPSPTSSLEPSPLPSPEPKGLEGKVLQFEKKLEEVDLEEEELTPPTLDFEIRFKID